MRLFVFLIAICATSVSADQPMTGPEFEAYVTGRIVSFKTAGNLNFGAEHFLERRRVLWSSGNNACKRGVWYESKGNICFRYDGDPTPKCWAIYRDKNGMRAVYTTRPNTTVIFEADDHSVPLLCGEFSS